MFQTVCTSRYKELIVKMNYVLVIMIITIISFEAIVKYTLYLLGLSILYNLFFAIVLMAFIFNIFLYFLEYKILKRALFVFLITLTGTMIFFFQNTNLFQYFLGLYSLSVFFYALSIPSKTYFIVINNHKLFISLFLLVAIGIVIDYIFQGNLPYKNFSYSIGDVERAIDKVYAGYFYRASGWQKNQLESSLLLFFFYYLVSLRGMNKIRAFLLYLFTLFLLILCFNKTIIVAFILFGIFKLIKYKAILKLIITVMLIISSILPFYLQEKFDKFDYHNSSLEEAIVFASFYDRVNNAWKNSIDNTEKYLGNGIGGIGVGYNTFNDTSNPIDNAPLYIFGIFGYIGLLFFNIYFLKLIYQLKNKNLLIFIASLSTIFLTINILEVKFFILMFMLVWMSSFNDNNMNLRKIV